MGEEILNPIELPNIPYDNNTAIRIFMTTYGNLINALVEHSNAQDRIITVQAEQIKTLTESVKSLNELVSDGL